MRFHSIPNELFIRNRKRYTDLLLPGSVAVFQSNDEMHRNGDQNFPYRQHSDFFYLTGISQEKSILLLVPGHSKYAEVLFLLETNEHIAVWNGHKYTQEEASQLSGIKKVMWLNSFDAILDEVMMSRDNIYVNTMENPRYTMDYPTRDLRFISGIRDKFPAHKMQRSAPLLKKLRMVKQKEEIEVTQSACQITAGAFNRVLTFVKPGIMEYEVQALIEYEFTSHKAWNHSYYPIVASGKSACVLHYIDNDKECKDGDLLLLDFGAEYNGYSSDLSRTIPVNGKFSPRQKDVYNAVLRVMKLATAMMVPGTTIDAYHAEVCKLMEKEMIGLGLFTQEDVDNQNPDKPLYMKYFMHGTGHFMGLDVHDVGTRQDTLEAGNIITCEPGMYIPEEGIGIRIENDIIITENGPLDLMNNIPLEVEDIERIMAERK